MAYFFVATLYINAEGLTRDGINMTDGRLVFHHTVRLIADSGLFAETDAGCCSTTGFL